MNRKKPAATPPEEPDRKQAIQDSKQQEAQITTPPRKQPNMAPRENPFFKGLREAIDAL